MRNVDQGALLIVLAALGGMLVAVLAFWRTPAAQRWRLSTTARDRERARIDERVRRGELVVIEGQPRRAGLRLAVWALPWLPALAAVLARALRVDLMCQRVAGWNAALLLLQWITWVLPAAMLATTLALAHLAWRGLRSGCFPPQDAVLPWRGHGDRTWRGRLRAALLLPTPLLALGILALAMQLQASLSQGRSAAQMQAALERGCPGP